MKNLTFEELVVYIAFMSKSRVKGFKRRYKTEELWEEARQCIADSPQQVQVHVEGVAVPTYPDFITYMVSTLVQEGVLEFYQRHTITFLRLSKRWYQAYQKALDSHGTLVHPNVHKLHALFKPSVKIN